MKRFAKWAAVAMLVGIAAILLASPHLKRVLEERLRREAELRAARILGATVTISRAQISLARPALNLLDIHIARSGNRGSQADVSIERVGFRAGVLTLLGLRRRSIEVSVGAPRLTLVLAEGQAAHAGTEAPAAAIDPGLVPPGSSLDLSDGEIDVAVGDGPRVSLRGVRLRARGGPAEGGLRGRAEFEDGAIRGLAGDWEGLRGEGSFEVAADGLRLESLSIRGQGITIAGNALLKPGPEPDLEGSLRASVDLAALARVLPEGAAPQGRIDIGLEGRWSAGDLRAEGKVGGAALSLWGLPVDSLGCHVRIGEGLRIDEIRAHLLGGAASGSIEVPRPGDAWRAEAEVRLDGLDLVQVLQLAQWTGPEVRGTIHYRGRHSLASAGVSSLRGTGVLDARGHFSVAGQPERPLEATARLETDGVALRLEGGTVRAGSVSGAFSGSLSPGEGLRLHLKGATGDLSEILPLFSAPAPAKPRRRSAFGRLGLVPARLVTRGAADPPPEESALQGLLRSLGGVWRWDGEIRYGARGFRFKGTLAADGLKMNGADLGSAEAEVDYVGERLTIAQATLRHATGGEVRLQGTVDLEGREPMDLQVTAADVPIAALQAVAGWTRPAIDGRMRATLRAGGPVGAPEVRGSIETGALRVAGVDFDGLEGKVEVTPRLLGLHGLVVRQGPAVLSAEGSLPFRAGPGAPPPIASAGASAPAGLTLAAEGIELSRWSKATGGLPLAGTAALHGTIAGSLEEPEGTLTLDGQGVEVSGRALGALRLEAGLLGAAMTVRGGLAERGITLEARFERAGEDAAGEAGGRTFELKVGLSEAELKGPEILAGLPDDVGLVLAGTLDAAGRVDRLQESTARLSLQVLKLRAAGVEVQAEGPVEAAFEGGRLRLGPTVLSGSGTQIDLRGEADTKAGGRLDLEARGRFDLALLRLLARNLQASGQGEIELQVGGSRDAPVFQGRLQVRAEAVRYPDLPFPVSNLNARAVFDGSGARIEELTLQAGTGTITGGGSVALGGTGFRSPFSVRSAEVRLEGKGVRADFPEGFRSLSDMDLTLRVDPEGATLAGRIDLVRGVYSRDFRIESSLVGARGPAFMDFEAPSGPIAALNLDLTLSAAGSVWLRNDFASLEGEGTLRVTGTAARPSVAGRITAVEGGTIRFRNVRYRVQQGTLDFKDPESINPVFDLSAETTVAEYQVTLRVEGTVDHFDYELSSTPPLPQPDIVALLLTGRTRAGLGPEGGSLAEETVSAYLAGRLSQELTDRLSGKVGLDVLAIDPLQTTGQGDPVTRITLGKQITPDLLVTYSDELGGTAGSIYQLDYALGRRLKITSVRSPDGSIGADLRAVLRSAPPSLPALDAVPAQKDRPMLGAVRVLGDLRVEEGKVLRRLRIRPGRPRDRAAVNDGVERLLAYYRDRGYLMAEVSVEETPAGPGAVDLAVHVSPGPRVTIETRGVRLHEGLRRTLEPYWQKGIFLDDIVEAARDRIRSEIEDRGYLKADVTSGILENDAHAFRVRFTIRRGPRVRAGEVRVAGARQIPEKEILEELRTSPDGAFSRGIVRAGRLRADVATIQALYAARGFPRASVGPPDLAFDASGRRATVTFTVEEGPRVAVRAVRFEGASSFPEGRLAGLAALPEGAPYTQETAEAAVARLRRAYDEAGFPDARVRFRREAVAHDEESEEDDLVFTIEEGTAQVVGNVDVSGNLITRDRVVRSALTVKPGDALSRADLLDSQTRLYRRGLFTSVQAQAEASSGAPPSGPAPRDVRVEVREAAPLTQVFGIGYDSTEKFRGQYEISNRNILGNGRYLGLQTRASRIEQRASVLFRELGTFGGRYDVTASSFYENERRPAFDVRTIGSGILFGRQVTRATRILYRYSLRDVDLSEASAAFDGTTLRLSGLAGSAVHDTRDAPFEPSRGHYLGADAQLYGAGIGSEADFTKFYAQVFHFWTVLPGIVWAQAVRAGATFAFGRSRRDPAATGDAESGVPPSERFFAGGDTTLRGFKQDIVGPLDAQGGPIGGEGLFILNEELRVPIYRKLQGVVFLDLGNVFRTLPEYDIFDLRQVGGLGLRIATPIGPFRLEYGAVLDRKEDEPPGRLFFSIGQAF